MEIILAVLGLILAIAVPVFIYYWRKQNVGAELTIEIEKDGSQSSPIGISNKNIPDENNTILVTQVIRIFELSWHLNIVIRNNSDNVAYYPKITFKEGKPHLFRIDKLNVQEPIASTEFKKLKLTYKEFEEAKGTERNDMMTLPEALLNLEILLEYKNSYKVTFYTLFNYRNNTNEVLKKKPKGF